MRKQQSLFFYIYPITERIKLKLEKRVYYISTGNRVEIYRHIVDRKGGAPFPMTDNIFVPHD